MKLRQIALLVGVCAVSYAVFAQSSVGGSARRTAPSDTPTSSESRDPSRTAPALPPRNDVVDRATATPSGTAARAMGADAARGGAGTSNNPSATGSSNGTSVNSGVGASTVPGIGAGIGSGGVDSGADVGVGAPIQGGTR